MSQPILQMSNVHKRFGPTLALRGVSLEVQHGQVMALIGENGAGKSTLMKVLSGALQPDAGEIKLEGQAYRPTSPKVARERGIAMIYQELNLAPDLSVEDNIMLGMEHQALGFLQRGSQRMRVREALELLGHAELRPQTIVNQLSVGAQQLVEIARALVSNAKVIVFDEPTSSLTKTDVEHLFRVVERLKESGISVVYISHFLEEIREICSDYTVLRDGETVGAGSLANVTEEQIISLMVGRDVDDLFPTVPHEVGEPILDLKALTGSPIPIDVNLQLRRGEILGIAGLVGAGRTELLRTIYGLDPIRSGELRLYGKPQGGTPHQMIKAGLGMVSEDRKTEGLAQDLSIEDNLTLSNLSRCSTAGMLRLVQKESESRELMESVAVKAHSPKQPVSALSGGNQQKVAIARVLYQSADILLLDEPTRGIDVGTKAEIYRMMGDLAKIGRAIIFVSSYLPELMAVCDRIAVMSRGRIREVRSTDLWTEEDVMACAVSTDES